MLPQGKNPASQQTVTQIFYKLHKENALSSLQIIQRVTTIM